jgi:hypothetical protein
MLPDPGQVMHFSEDPTLTVFRPHVAPTAREPEAYVWAVDAQNAPSYWFPRDCPRVCTWPAPGAPGHRVHAIEYGWLDRLRTVRLFAYRFAGEAFQPIGTPYPHARVSTEVVRPLGPPEEVGDLLAVHEAAGVELRLMSDLPAYMADVVGSGLRFSGIRLRNAGRPG